MTRCAKLRERETLRGVEALILTIAFGVVLGAILLALLPMLVVLGGLAAVLAGVGILLLGPYLLLGKKCIWVYFGLSMMIPFIQMRLEKGSALSSSGGSDSAADKNSINVISAS